MADYGDGYDWLMEQFLDEEEGPNRNMLAQMISLELRGLDSPEHHQMLCSKPLCRTDFDRFINIGVESFDKISEKLIPGETFEDGFTVFVFNRLGNRWNMQIKETIIGNTVVLTCVLTCDHLQNFWDSQQTEVGDDVCIWLFKDRVDDKIAFILS